MPPKPGSQKRVRMKDVADRCGVSISTVSLVLSGDPRIPEDTAKAVLQAVKALEYRPSVVARNLARRSSRTIAVILPEHALTKNQPYFYQIMCAIHSITQAAGYKIVMEAANPSFLERRYYHRLLKEQSADGVIYMAAGFKDIFLSDMTKEPYPFVLLGEAVEEVDLPLIACDHRRGAELAVGHLIGLGHKKIGHLAAPQNYFSSLARTKGYKNAMQKGGLAIDPSWIQECDLSLEQAKEKTRILINQGVTALFVSHDVMAYAALAAIQESGKSVPQDVAVVAMDNVELSAWMNPSLTTVSYDMMELAVRAAKFVINRIQSPLVDKKLLEDTPEPQLIVRSTCGAKT